MFILLPALPSHWCIFSKNLVEKPCIICGRKLSCHSVKHLWTFPRFRRKYQHNLVELTKYLVELTKYFEAPFTLVATVLVFNFFFTFVTDESRGDQEIVHGFPCNGLSPEPTLTYTLILWREENRST